MKCASGESGLLQKVLNAIHSKHMAKGKKAARKIQKKSGRRAGTPQMPEDFLFDDCVICQAERNAQKSGRGMSLEELQAAFREAEKKGAIVGGPTAEDGLKKEKK